MHLALHHLSDLHQGWNSFAFRHPRLFASAHKLPHLAGAVAIVRLKTLDNGRRCHWRVSLLQQTKCTRLFDTKRGWKMGALVSDTVGLFPGLAINAREQSRPEITLTRAFCLRRRIITPDIGTPAMVFDQPFKMARVCRTYELNRLPMTCVKERAN